jgi:hypothetical protein
MTERQRLAEKKKEESMLAFIRQIDRRKAVWMNLSEQDKARFNDFHYEHAVGRITDAEYESMKKELHDKTCGAVD